MPLETGSSINDLVTTNPASSDAVGAGDDHLRLIKTVIKASFPNMGGAAWRNLSKSGTYTATPADNFAQITHVSSGPLHLPAATSVSTGFMLLINPYTAGVTTAVVPAGVDTINAVTATAAVQFGQAAFLLNAGASSWNLIKLPHLSGDNLFLAGGVSISGGAVIGGSLAVGGAISSSAVATLQSLELLASGGTPFIDFRNDAPTDFDMRLILTGNDTLNVTGGGANGLEVDAHVVYNRNNILGTTSQSGGVPTGALIEVGSNGNGFYARYAGNVQICVASVDAGQESPTSHGWAANFAATPVALVCNDDTVETSNSVTLNVSSTAYEFQSTTASNAVHVIAVGIWF